MRLPILAVAWASITIAGCSTRSPDAGPSLPPPPPSGIKTENYDYTRWAKFKPGTVMIVRTTTEKDGHPDKSVEVVTSTLISLAEEEAVVESSQQGTRFDGVNLDTRPLKLPVKRYFYLQEPLKADASKDRRSEQITVAGKTYQARVVTGKSSNEAGEVDTTVWASDDVPGGLLKSITRIPATGKKTSIELIELKPAG